MQKIRFLSQLTVLILIGRMMLPGGNFEQWCPFGGVETSFLYFTEDSFTCSLGSSNLYLILAILALTLISRRSFCSYACPIGTLGEWSGKLRRRFRPKKRWKRWSPPPKVDWWLRKIKYPVLGIILWLTITERELIFRTFDPFYALCSQGGEDVTFWSYAMLGGVILGALFVALPFCRYLCPLAAFLNPFSKIGFLRVRRDPDACVDCSLCDDVCEQGIDVSKHAQITHARCTQCGECITACPLNKALYLGMPGKDEPAKEDRS